MSSPDTRSWTAKGSSETGSAVRRVFAEFLTIPTWIVAGFLLLAAGAYALDHAAIGGLGPFREAMREHVFGDPQATGDLLGTIAGGLFTVTSITISLVLLAVQQAAGSMTFAVIDQFLRRRLNQLTFGFFVGLALYTLVTLSTVNPPFNPVYGATLALLLAGVALYLLLILLHTTINQMRPAEIIHAIHDHVLVARASQLSLIQKTRRESRFDGGIRALVRTPVYGFVVRVDLEAIAAAARDWPGEVEIVLLVSVGSYVAFQDVIAEVKTRSPADLAKLEAVIQQAVRIERQRDLDRDPAYGIEQIAMIAWTSVSTSKSNPDPGLMGVRGLRDLLARWSTDQAAPADDDDDEPPAPVVYSDNVVAQLFDAFESLAVASTESMQHQVFAEIVRTFAIMFDRLPADQQWRAEDLIRRIISGLGDHVLTADLDAALGGLVGTLSAATRLDTAAAVAAAQTALAASVGQLNSRSTRVPTNS